MLDEKKLREKIEELNAQKLSNRIEWTEEGTAIGYAGDVTEGLRTDAKQYMLEEISQKAVKLYMRNNAVGIYESVMVFNK